MTEYGPYGPIDTDLDRAQTEAWLEEDRRIAADRAAEDERFAALTEAERLAELTEADWSL